MREKKDFEELLVDEEFQNGIIRFDSYNSHAKKEFIECYSLTNEEFGKARVIISGLSLKEKSFSDDELEYLFQNLNVTTHKVNFLSNNRFNNALGWFSRVAAILIIPLFLSTVWFYLRKTELQSKADELSLLADVTNTVFAPIGGQTTAVLPDGSEVWLNSDSRITYPAIFRDNERDVEISGEAYFKVKKGKTKFVVKTTGPSIVVHGTEFNVHAYQNEKMISVALVEGKISLKKEGQGQGKKPMMMTPGEIAFFDKDNGTLEKKKGDVYIYTCWKDGKYVFRGTALSDILKILERKYDVEFEILDSDVGHFKYEATFTNEPITQILELLSFSSPLHYQYIKPIKKQDGNYSKAKVKLWK